MDKSDDRSDEQGQRRRRPLRTEGEEKLWDVKDVADFFNCSESWVYKAAAEGNLPTVRIPGMTRVRFRPSQMRAVVKGEWKPADVIPLKAG